MLSQNIQNKAPDGAIRRAQDFSANGMLFHGLNRLRIIAPFRGFWFILDAAGRYTGNLRGGATPTGTGANYSEEVIAHEFT